jgi:hypothetical protein
MGDGESLALVGHLECESLLSLCFEELALRPESKRNAGHVIGSEQAPRTRAAASRRTPEGFAQKVSARQSEPQIG